MISLAQPALGPPLQCCGNFDCGTCAKVNKDQVRIS
jgi:hypothetical protein